MSQTTMAGQAALFTVAVAPARAVYLIAEGSRPGFRRAVQEATTRWGGVTEPIVEVSPNGTVRPGDRVVVEKANLDGAVNVDVPDEFAATAAASLSLDLTPIRWIDAMGPTRFNIHPAGLGLVANTIDGSNGYVIPSEDSPLWQAAAAGDLATEHQASLPSGLLTVRRARQAYEIGQAQLWDHALVGRTAVSLRDRWASPGQMDSPMIIWLTRDDALADCIEFWNLRALRPPHATIPMVLLPADVADWTTWPIVLHQALRRPGVFSPDVLITSTTGDREGLDAFARRVGLDRAEDEEIRRRSTSSEVPVRSAPFTYLTGLPLPYFAFDRKYGEVEYVDVPIVREKITLRFLSPVPVKPVASGFALARVIGGPLDGLPQLESVAKLVDDQATWRNEEIQLPVSLMRDIRLELRVPTLATACEVVLAERTQAHTISHKGAIGMSLLDDDAAAALGEPHVYEAIRQLTTPRGAAIAKTLQGLFGSEQPLSEEQTAFAERFAGRSEQVYRTPARLGHGTTEAAAVALERLVGIGWAERGLETHCAGCGLKRFTPFSTEVARGSGRCPVCKAAADYTRTSDGPTVHYRLDGRVDQANDQGVIVHLMVIGALARRYKHVWLAPGMDLVFHDGSKRETDIFGVCDGQLVSGEVKMSGESFTTDQIERDIDTSTRLGTKLHVMAASTPVPQHAKALAQARCAEKDIELILLERDDLRG